MSLAYKAHIFDKIFCAFVDIVSKFRLLKSKQVISALAHNLEKVSKLSNYLLLSVNEKLPVNQVHLTHYNI